MSENKKSTKHAFKAPAFQLYAKEFLQDEAVIAMELDAAGAYIILLCHQWTEGSIPADPALLARICRTTPERIEAIWPQLEGKFSRKESHNKKRLVNRKLELIRKEKNNFIAIQTQHGLNGAAAKRHPERNPIPPEINDLDRVAHDNPMASLKGSDSSGSGSGSGIEEADTTHTPDCSSDSEKTSERTDKRTLGNASGKPPMRSRLSRSEDLPANWTELDVSNLAEQLGAFMDGDQPPAELTEWILCDLVRKYSLSATEMRDALQAAWHRNGAPGRKNAPRDWNWFYEVLRNAFIPEYEARVCGP